MWEYVGGFVGEATAANITDSYAIGNVICISKFLDGTYLCGIFQMVVIPN